MVRDLHQWLRVLTSSSPESLDWFPSNQLRRRVLGQRPHLHTTSRNPYLYPCKTHLARPPAVSVDGHPMIYEDNCSATSNILSQTVTQEFLDAIIR
jgi:hypothetical protein